MKVHSLLSHALPKRQLRALLGFKLIFLKNNLKQDTVIYKSFSPMHIWSLVKWMQSSSQKIPWDFSLQVLCSASLKHPLRPPMAAVPQITHGPLHSQPPAKMLTLTMESWSWPRLYRKEWREENKHRGNLKIKNVTSEKNSWNPHPQDSVLQKEVKNNFTLWSWLAAQLVCSQLLSDSDLILTSLFISG